MRSPVVAMLLSGLIAAPARADVKATAAREAAEYVLRTFGRSAAREGTETLAGRIAAAASRHGDDAIAAVRRVGPKALTLADEAGGLAPGVLRLLSRHGEDAAAWVVERPGAMRLFERYGDEAAEALLRHKGLAEPLIEEMGAPAARALGVVGRQGGRRMAIMAESGELAAIGREPELMGVIARHGDAAMDFIWRNKGALAVSTALAAFLADPGPFIAGTNRLAGTVGEDLVRPVAQETAGALSWLIRAGTILLLFGIGGAGFLAARHPRTAAGLGKALVTRLSAHGRP